MNNVFVSIFFPCNLRIKEMGFSALSDGRTLVTSSPDKSSRCGVVWSESYTLHGGKKNSDNNFSYLLAFCTLK